MLASLMFIAPGREAVAMAGTATAARRMRNGYRVTGERRNGRYERITGSAGRVLMVKQFDTR